MNALGLIAGGSLLVSGAVLPWLTLYAGLDRYSGLIGVYGWAILAAGIVAIASGIIAVKVKAVGLAPASGVFGCAVLAFSGWLFAGLQQVVHRPEAMMLVPRAGPGLYVAMSGAAMIVLVSLPPALRHARNRSA